MCKSELIYSNMSRSDHLSMKKDMDVDEILMDRNREQNSASIERIILHGKLNSDELLRQKPIFYPLENVSNLN